MVLLYVDVRDAAGQPPSYPALPAASAHPVITGDLNGDALHDFVAVRNDGVLLEYTGAAPGSLTAFGGTYTIVARVGTQLRVYPGNGTAPLGSPIVMNGHGTGWSTTSPR
ncbi:hypothetical protein ABZ901_31050 [Actinacidiphila alni]|uniref:hypothetical protein n=1 Tax=Actinacidiphila alni TaxID=380248 RepID=UPI0033F13057